MGAAYALQAIHNVALFLIFPALSLKKEPHLQAAFAMMLLDTAHVADKELISLLSITLPLGLGAFRWGETGSPPPKKSLNFKTHWTSRQPSFICFILFS